MNAQENQLQNDFDYQNFNKYYEKALEASNDGQEKQLANYLKYANKHLQKLEKKSYDLNFMNGKVSNLKELENRSGQSREKEIAVKKANEYLLFYAQPLSRLSSAKVANGGEAYVTMFNEFDRTTFLGHVNVFTNNASLFTNDRPTCEKSIQYFKQIEEMLASNEVILGVDQYITSCKNEFDNHTYEMYLKNLKGVLSSLNKVAPTNQVFLSRLQQVNELEASKTDLLIKNEQEEKNNIRDRNKITSLPEREVKDPALENEFLELVKKQASAYEVKELIINSKYWSEEKNLGVLVRRRRLAVAVMKDRNSACYLGYYLFAQNYSNGNFGESYLESNEGIKEVDCQIAK